MNRVKVLNLKKFNSLFGFLSKNNVLLVLLSVFIAGFCFGIFYFGKNQSVINFFESYLEHFYTTRTETEIFDISIKSFFSYLLVLLFIFVFGSSMLGVVFLPTLTAIIGSFYGGLSAFLYSEFSLKGVAFNSIIILPTAVIFIISIIFFGKEAFVFSVILAKQTFSEAFVCRLPERFKYYCTKFLIIFIPIVISSIVDGILSHKFLKGFDLF